MLKKITIKIQNFKSFRNSYYIEKNMYAINEWRKKIKTIKKTIWLINIWLSESWLADTEFWLGYL